MLVETFRSLWTRGKLFEDIHELPRILANKISSTHPNYRLLLLEIEQLQGDIGAFQSGEYHNKRARAIRQILQNTGNKKTRIQKGGGIKVAGYTLSDSDLIASFQGRYDRLKKSILDLQEKIERHKQKNKLGKGHVQGMLTSKEISSISKTELLLGKIHTRLQTIQADMQVYEEGRFEQSRNELSKISNIIDQITVEDALLSDHLSQLVQNIRDMIQSISSIQESSISGLNTPSSIVYNQVSSDRGQDAGTDSSMEGDRELKIRIDTYFRNLRKHIRISSSTNITNQGSQGDGNFTIKVLKPFIHFVQKKLHSGVVNPLDFTLQDIAYQWKEEVSFHGMPPIFHQFIAHIGPVDDSSRRLSYREIHIELRRVILTLRGSSGLFSPNALKIIEGKLSDFSPPPER